MNADSVLLRKMTRREIRERLQNGHLQACILPIAAIEQHLEHLAIEHDWRSVTELAVRIAQRLAPHVTVAEGVMAGVSEHHMRHPGTLTLRPGTMLSVLADLVRSLHMAGFRNILVLNGHGGNIAPCRATWDQFQREFPCNLQLLSYWDVLNQQDARELLRHGSRLPEDLPGHAQEFETALALALFPENVRKQAVADQSDQTPAVASADQGAQFVERIVERLASHLQAMIDGDNRVEIPAFFP